MTRQVTSREWARQKARKTLKRRTSQEWKQAIDGLKCGRTCRLLAACIVWWDYFAKKPAVPHDATLDLYKNDWDYMVVRREPISVRAASLVRALVAIGYAEAIARKRSEVLR